MDSELHPTLLKNRCESTGAAQPRPVDLVVPATSPGEHPSVVGSQPHDRRTPRHRLLLAGTTRAGAWPEQQEGTTMNEIRTPPYAVVRGINLRDCYVVSGG